MTAPEMTKEKATQLRKPFPPDMIGKLPRATNKDNAKGKCNECGGWHGLPAVHLDFVGHAAVTDRLLTVDPHWTWRPFNSDEIAALPPALREGGLWIWLTVCGVTKPGFGDAEGKRGGNAIKEMISDALRNASMRFGVALDLWAKENLHEFAQSLQEVEPRPAAQQVDTPPPTADNPTPGKRMTAKQRSLMFALFAQKGIAEADQLSGINAICGTHYESRGDLTEQHARVVIDRLQTMPDVDTPAFDPATGEVLA